MLKLSISKNLIEEPYPQDYDETENEVKKEIILFNYKKLKETNNEVNSQHLNSKKRIGSIRSSFSWSSFTINYILIINSVIITSIILSLWLLTLIGGIFNNTVLILGIILIILIFMIFESLSLLEKEIAYKSDKKDN